MRSGPGLQTLKTRILSAFPLDTLQRRKHYAAPFAASRVPSGNLLTIPKLGAPGGQQKYG